MISVVIPSSRIEKEVAPYVPKWVAYADRLRREGGPELETEFGRLLVECVLPDTTNYLEPILNSLEKQTYRDFEVIIVRGPWWWYPAPPRTYSFPLKLVDEKESIWHKLDGGPYYTEANANNTGVLYAKGDLIFLVDDTMILPEHILARAQEYWNEGKYLVCSYDRFDRIEDDRMVMTYRLRISDAPVHCQWRAIGIVETEAVMELNGWDETLDGAFGWVNTEFGWRLRHHPEYGRKPYLDPDVRTYHLTHADIRHPPTRTNVRDNLILFDILKRVRIGLAANTARPTATENAEYARRHGEEHPDVPLHEYAFAYEKVPTFDLKTLRAEVFPGLGSVES